MISFAAGVITALKGCLWALLTLAASVRAGEPVPVTVPLQVRSVAGARTPNYWPVTTGVPFRDGQLAEEKLATLRVETDSGRAIPAQFEVRGRYPKSKNVRWLGVDFQLDPAVKEYRLVFDGKAGSVHPQPVRIDKEQEAFVVTTGGLKAEVPRQGGLLRRVWLEDEMLLEQGPNDGNWLTTVEGTRHGEAGAKAVVEREGPLHATLRVDGVYADPAGKPSCRWTARLHFYAGQPMIHVPRGTAAFRLTSSDASRLVLRHPAGREATLTPLGSGQYRVAVTDGAADGLWSVSPQEVVDVAFAEIQPVFANRVPASYFEPAGVRVKTDLPPAARPGESQPRPPARGTRAPREQP